MAYLIVRRKDDNIVEWIGHDSEGTWQDVANGEDPATHFTIAEAEAEWGLPENGFDYGGRDKITYDGNLPDGFEAGVSVLNGSEGSYSWA